VKRFFTGALTRLVQALPRHRFLEHLALQYVFKYRGENAIDPRINGEDRVASKVLPPATVIFDVGANVGAWAEQAARWAPRACIHCFEPSAATFAQLTARGLPPERVVLNAFGLGDKAQTRTLYQFAGQSGLSSLYDRTGLEAHGVGRSTGTEEIRLETGDDYCRRQGLTHVDFIKVDVEGHELAVFQGLRGLLAAGGVDYLQFEYGGAYIDARILLKDIFEFFAPLPYDLCKIFPRWVQKVERYVQQLETFQYQNWLIVRRGLPLP